MRSLLWLPLFFFCHCPTIVDAYYRRILYNGRRTSTARGHHGGAGYSQGTLPVVHCYSCMSYSYQEHWLTMRYIYQRPELFSDRCNEPFLSRGIPVQNCTNICVTMKEPEVKGGLILGYNYIRGCADKVLVAGFNRSALETHRFPDADVCRLLPRGQLINSRGLTHSVVGDVLICSCYENRCNGATISNAPCAALCRLTAVLLLLITVHSHLSWSFYFY